VQLGDPHRRSGGGLGIGLALADSLVRMHGGRLTARSEGVGRGAEFEVRVPVLAEEVPEEAHDAGHEHRAHVQRRHILTVDDNEDALFAVAAALRLQGHRVDTASNGWQALERAQALRPEAILLDIGMPDMDGYEVARRIRAAAWGDSTLIIAMTGWGQERDRQAAFAAGCDAHLTKPANQRAIAALLERREELLEQRGALLRLHPPN
jgi:two-component system, chemotaxis family, CheB/CheR fusion protein